MSEVKRFDFDIDEACANIRFVELADGGYTLFTDFDAQRLRADTAEANFNRCNGLYYECQKERNTLRSDIAAAEQRVASMRYALEVAEERLLVAERHLDLGEDDSVNFEHSILTVRAALNPNPEAESHE